MRTGDTVPHPGVPYAVMMLTCAGVPSPFVQYNEPMTCLMSQLPRPSVRKCRNVAYLRDDFRVGDFSSAGLIRACVDEPMAAPERTNHVHWTDADLLVVSNVASERVYDKRWTDADSVYYQLPLPSVCPC